MALRMTTTNTMRTQENSTTNVAKRNILQPINRRAALGDIGNNRNGRLEKTKGLKKVEKKPTQSYKEQVDVNLPEFKKLTVSKEVDTDDAFSNQLLHAEDIDKDDHDNPQLVSELVNDIYDYLRELEARYPIKANYLQGKPINAKMRTILVDWLIQVHTKFNLLPETLYLTVAMIDRFLQDVTISRNKLQLVGVTAMFIASKYEEVYAPEIGDFVYMTDNTYTKAEIRRMEIIMLKALNFSLGRPLPPHFLRRNSKAGKANTTMHALAKYLMELTLLEYSMVSVAPSKVAAAGLCLAMKILDMKNWDDTLVFYSKYNSKELRPVMEKMLKLVKDAENSAYQAIRTKYARQTFLKISCLQELKNPLLHSLLD